MRYGWIHWLLLAALALIACRLSASPPTSTPCAWNWAYDSVPPEIQKELQQAFAEAGIPGTIDLSSYGENGGNDCSYHEMGVTAEIIVYVHDTSDLPTLSILAMQIEEILSQSPGFNKPSLADGSRLTFKGIKGGEQSDCIWEFKSQQCH